MDKRLTIDSGETEWSEVIGPRGKWFDLRLKEVWRYRDLLFLFVKRDFAAQYRQTVLGPLWHLLQPVFTTLMFLLLFNKIAKIPTDGLPPVLFYMSSITAWNFFTNCFTSTSSTFLANAGIFGKVYFPRLVSPLSTVLSGLVRFGIQFSLLLAVILYYWLTGQFQFYPGWHLILLPLIVLCMALTGLGAGIIISSLTTKYRDLNILINFGVNLLMYVTPVAYPLSFLATSPYQSLIAWNPLSPLVEGFRYGLFGIGVFNEGMFAYSVIVMVVVLLCGMLLFSKVERSFMDTV